MTILHWYTIETTAYLTDGRWRYGLHVQCLSAQADYVLFV